MSDSLSCGRSLRILKLIDDFSWESLAAVVDASLSGERVAREMDHIVEMHGGQGQWNRGVRCIMEVVGAILLARRGHHAVS